MQPVVDFKFIENGGQVGFDRSFGNIQFGGYSFVVFAGLDQIGNFEFPAGEQRQFFAVFVIL